MNTSVGSTDARWNSFSPAKTCSNTAYRFTKSPVLSYAPYLSCNYTYANEKGLCQHINTYIKHSNPHSLCRCNRLHCSYSTKTEGYLQHHESRVHGVHMCPHEGCQKVYGGAHLLTLHSRKDHEVSSSFKPESKLIRHQLQG